MAKMTAKGTNENLSIFDCKEKKNSLIKSFIKKTMLIREIIREKSFQQKAIYNMYNNLRIA